MNLCTFCDRPATGTESLPDGSDPVPACDIHDDARRMAREYRQRFGFRLYTRLSVLAERYPSTEGPSFISWEGEGLTGADTSSKVRALLRACPQDE